MITLQKLAAFNAAFDNCKANHPNHGWYHSLAEGLKAVDGEGNLKLEGEELKAVEEMQEAHRIKDTSETYDRPAAIRKAFKETGKETEAENIIKKYNLE